MLLTLLPSAGVLWFMNAAVTSEQAAAQQRVIEADRGQLRLVPARMDPLWRAHMTRLEGAGWRYSQLSLSKASERVGDGAHAPHC